MPPPVLPNGLQVVRTAGPFDADSLPAGLRAHHRVADGVWARLRVIEGAVGFEIQTDPPFAVRLTAGDSQAIPPGVPHRVIVEAAMRIEIDFLRSDGDERVAVADESVPRPPT